MIVTNTKKIYKSYKFDNRLKSFVNLQAPTTSMDRYYMDQLIQPCIDFLLKEGLTEYEDFARLFKRYKLKNEDIINFIKSFEYFINSSPNEKKIFWIRTRELKKANFSEKNIIITRLIVEYYDSFISFFSNYIITNFFSIHNIQILINEIERKAKLIMNKIEQNKLNSSKTEITINDEFENKFEPLLMPITELKETSQSNDIKIIKSNNIVRKIIILKS